MQYDKGKHCTFHHRYHLVWITQYRYKVLHGDVGLRVREFIRQVCSENGVEIIQGVLAGGGCANSIRSMRVGVSNHPDYVDSEGFLFIAVLIVPSELPVMAGLRNTGAAKTS